MNGGGSGVTSLLSMVLPGSKELAYSDIRRGSMNELPQVIKKRLSIRKFERRAVPEEVIRDILDCARLGPNR